MAMGRAATKLYILYSHPTRSRAAGLNWSAWAARRPPARVGKGQRGKARGMRGMPTHLDHREALLPSGLPLAVVGHLLPKVFPALRNQRLDDLLPLLRPCASARRFRGLDTRGFAGGRGAGTSAVRLLNPVGGVRLQLLQLHLRGSRDRRLQCSS